VPLRSWIKRLEHAARGNLASFELLDGSSYYFDPGSWSLFLHWYECITAGSAHNWPEPPEVMRKVCEAKDPQLALEQVMADSGTFSYLVYDPEVISTERRLEPRGLITRYDPQTGKHHVRNPYEDSCEDLSE
jgi:hypothetical protein